MTTREKIRHLTQSVYGLPILWFAITMIYLDTSGKINVEKFGYAFFGGIIGHFLAYFFRKSVPGDNPK